MLEMQTMQDTVSATRNDIYLTNIEDGEIFYYSLIVLKGSVCLNDSIENTKKNVICCYNLDNPTIVESECCVNNTRFKILCSLTKGANHLVLKYCGTVLNITVTYSTRNSILHVLPIYIICRGSDGYFQAPYDVDNSAPSACKRIATGMKLIQCLMAEKLYEAKLGRKTFLLQNDLDNKKPECTIFHSELTVDEARKMKEGELWEYFARELMLSPLRSNDCKFIAFISCTRYCRDKLGKIPTTHEEVLSAMEAHAALGGGGLALFGSACLHTWPETISNIIPYFMDAKKVDKEQLMDDSFYRGTYGGCFTTTLGAVCHELGHTFDLGHSHGGIMGRGFDSVNLVFTLETCKPLNDKFPCDTKGFEQHTSVSLSKTLDISCSLASPIMRPIKMIESGQRNTKQTMKKSNENQKSGGAMLHKSCHDRVDRSKGDALHEDRIFWSYSCAVLLAFHRWLNDDGEKDCKESQDVIKFDPIRKVMTSVFGLRVIELRDESSLVLQSWEFLEKNGKSIFILPSCSHHKTICSIVAEDSIGNILKCPILK